MKSTVEKLNLYGDALSKWKSQRDRYNLALTQNKNPRIKIGVMPEPISFELDANDGWVKKTRDKILGTVNIPKRKT